MSGGFMNKIENEKLQTVTGGAQTCSNGQSNLVKFDNGYLYGTVLVPPSNNGQILEIKMNVSENTLLGQINPFN